MITKKWSFDFLPDLNQANKGDMMQQIYNLILIALEEDVGSGDITTNGTVPRDCQAVGSFLAKADGVLAGTHIARLVFEVIDPTLVVEFSVRDGDALCKGLHFGTVRGSAWALLQGERLALNLMQRMSGIASNTRKMVNAVAGTCARILDTRKTSPGLRVLDKVAVRSGGGTNHRFGLFDMVMIKDNHVTACGGVTPAIRAVQAYLSARGERDIAIEVEARTLDEVREAVVAGGVNRILLDNMVQVLRDADGRLLSVDTKQLRQAVEIVNGKCETEASGNVTLDTVGPIAQCGVSYISSGALTHSVEALDISFKIQLLDSGTHKARL